MHYLLIWILLTMTLFSNTLEVAQDDNYRTLNFQTYTEVKTLNEIPLNLNNRQWQKNKSTLELNPEHKSYWIRLKLHNKTKVNKELYLMTERNYIYSLKYFLVHARQIISEKSYGFHFNNDKSSFNGTHVIIPLLIKANQSLEVFCKVQNFNTLDIPFRLVTQTHISDYLQTYNLLQGMFFGIIFIMALYNLSLYFLTKFKPYLYYVNYILFLNLYMLIYFGYLQRYLELRSLHIYAGLMIAAVGFILYMIFFLRELFSLKKYVPTLNKLFTFIIFYGITWLILFEILLYYDYFPYLQIAFNALTGMVPIFIGLLIFTLYYIAFTQKHHLAFIYAHVWSAVGIVGLALMLTYLGVISTEVGIDYYFEFSMVLESTLFSIMLALRIKEIEKEKEKQEKVLIQQSKLATMGEMISIIAHQWRQPLSQINGIVLSIDTNNRTKKLNNDNLNKDLDNIEEVTSYLSKTISDFMNFFKHDKESIYFDVASLFKKTLSLLSFSQETNNIEIVSDIKENTTIYGHESELIQALLILINNSIDAMASNRISKPKIILKATSTSTHQIITIEDNAGGIPKDIIEKIYDPYFTTKHALKGTGLGLYVVKMLMKQSMQGSVDIKNHKEGILATLIIPLNHNT